MSIQRRSANVSSTGSLPTVTTRVSGRYSLPRSTVNVYLPGGSDDRERMGRERGVHLDAAGELLR